MQKTVTSHGSTASSQTDQGEIASAFALVATIGECGQVTVSAFLRIQFDSQIKIPVTLKFLLDERHLCVEVDQVKSTMDHRRFRK